MSVFRSFSLTRLCLNKVISWDMSLCVKKNIGHSFQLNNSHSSTILSCSERPNWFTFCLILRCEHCILAYNAAAQIHPRILFPKITPATPPHHSAQTPPFLTLHPAHASSPNISRTSAQDLIPWTQYRRKWAIWLAILAEERTSSTGSWWCGQ